MLPVPVSNHYVSVVSTVQWILLMINKSKNKGKCGR